MRTRPLHAHSLGFTYIGLLVAVAILGFGLAAAGTVWRTAAQHERERDLLDIGHAFKAAIGSYYRAGGRFPQTLEDLVEDKRWPEPHRHLRRIYRDPMTGTAEWTLIQVEGIGITGVASTAAGQPLKRAGFSADETGFEDATCYCDWQFVYNPRALRVRGNASGVPPAAD
jgi:type II secretory pathway pseudopilin PulG